MNEIHDGCTCVLSRSDQKTIAATSTISINDDNIFAGVIKAFTATVRNLPRHVDMAKSKTPHGSRFVWIYIPQLTVERSSRGIQTPSKALCVTA